MRLIEGGVSHNHDQRVVYPAYTTVIQLQLPNIQLTAPIQQHFDNVSIYHLYSLLVHGYVCITLARLPLETNATVVLSPYNII